MILCDRAVAGLPNNACRPRLRERDVARLCPATPNSLPIPWSCPIGCNGPVYITTSPTDADSGCSIATGVIVPREVVDSRGLASHSSVPCGSRSSIRCVSARSSIAASHPRVAFGRQLSSSSFGHRGEGTKAHLKLQDVHPGRIPSLSHLSNLCRREYSSEFRRFS